MLDPVTKAKTSTLATLILVDPEALLRRWRERVKQLPSAKGLDLPALEDHVPALLGELCTALENPDVRIIEGVLEDGSPTEHGVQRLGDGFDLNEVVSEYNILRGCVHQLAEENGLKVDGRTFHILNRIFDKAIGLAVEAYAERKERELRTRGEKHLSVIVHELRNPLGAIALATNVLTEQLKDGDREAAVEEALRILRKNVGLLQVRFDSVSAGGDHGGDQ
jgi:signal transduction histidine kinase